jgi:hypothetical protein
MCDLPPKYNCPICASIIVSLIIKERKNWMRDEDVIASSTLLILVAHLSHDRRKSLPGIFIKSFYFNHGVDREEKPLQSNLFLIFDHYYDFVNFTLG